MLDFTEVRSFIIDSARRSARKLIGDKVDEIEIRDDTSLVASGLVDSLGFMNLLMMIEERFGVEVDLLDEDPVEFTTLGGLSRVVVGSAELL